MAEVLSSLNPVQLCVYWAERRNGGSWSLFPDGNYSESWIHNVAFDQEDIVNAINEIYHTAAAGPDRFPAVLLKHCRNALALWYKSLITEDCKYCTHP